MISRASEYAIRALTYLAMQEAGSFHLARDLGERLGIPAPFLAKILQPLVARGIVHSQRGRSGGFRLAREPEAIHLHEIVDSQEHMARARTCLLGQSECSDERACPLHEFWSEACRRYLTVLADRTLQDLAEFAAQSRGGHYPLPVPTQGDDGLLGGGPGVPVNEPVERGGSDPSGATEDASAPS